MRGRHPERGRERLRTYPPRRARRDTKRACRRRGPSRPLVVLGDLRGSPIAVACEGVGFRSVLWGCHRFVRGGHLVQQRQPARRRGGSVREWKSVAAEKKG